MTIFFWNPLKVVSYQNDNFSCSIKICVYLWARLVYPVSGNSGLPFAWLRFCCTFMILIFINKSDLCNKTYKHEERIHYITQKYKKKIVLKIATYKFCKKGLCSIEIFQSIIKFIYDRNKHYFKIL